MSTQTAPDQYLEHDGARLRFRLEGAGPAIALLHGWALDLDSWNSVAALLAPRFTVMRFDRRGFGLSQGLPDIHSNVADLTALLDAAGIGRAILLGMSQGARLAIHFALDQPARTRALLLDGAPALDAESDLPLSRYRSLLDAGGPAPLQAEILLHPLMQLHTTDLAVRQQLEVSVARYRGSDLLRSVSRATAPDLGLVCVPTLIVNGALDTPARREAASSLQSAIPRAHRRELAGAGHLAMLDDPVAYARLVMEFCGGLPDS